MSIFIIWIIVTSQSLHNREFYNTSECDQKVAKSKLNIHLCRYFIFYGAILFVLCVTLQFHEGAIKITRVSKTVYKWNFYWSPSFSCFIWVACSGSPCEVSYSFYSNANGSKIILQWPTLLATWCIQISYIVIYLHN